MENQVEEFRDVSNYGGVYSVSNLGRVKSLKFGKERILKQGLSSSKRPTVSLTVNNNTKTFRVSQLVAIFFLGHEASGHEIIVDHIDNNPVNNNVDNLQLITQRQNISKDSYRRKNNNLPIGVRRYGIKKYTYEARIMINKKQVYLGRFKTSEEASLKYKEALSKT
tara:strand:- start:3058 stop:3555 length:498 start_codon:yes stop_codon:yes gene_type:complete